MAKGWKAKRCHLKCRFPAECHVVNDCSSSRFSSPWRNVQSACPELSCVLAAPKKHPLSHRAPVTYRLSSSGWQKPAVTPRSRTFLMFSLDLTHPKPTVPLFYLWLCRVLLMKWRENQLAWRVLAQAAPPWASTVSGIPPPVSALLSLGWMDTVFRRQAASRFGLPCFRLSVGSEKNVTTKNWSIGF